MGREASSWDWLSAGINKTLPHFSVLDRVENGVLAGMADVNYCIRGVEGWIELKCVEMPKRFDTRVLGDKGLNLEQINWHLKRQAVLSNTFIFITAKPYRWLVGGHFAREVNNWSADDLCVHSRFWYDDNWKPQQWTDLLRILAPSPILLDPTRQL